MGSLAFPGVDSAISKFEGFGTSKAPTITTANNPGAIQAGSFATAHGATGALNGFAVFPDTTTGTAAEDALVSSYASQGLTIDQLINKWAPANAPGNDPTSTQNYVNSVANSLGVTPDTPLSDVQGKGNAPTSSSTPSLFQSACNKLFAPGSLGSVTFCGEPKPTASTAANPLANTSTFSWGRIAAFVLGLILITAGLYLFKPGIELTPGPIGRGIRKAGKAGATVFA